MDAIPTSGDPCGATKITNSLNVMTCNTCENSGRVPGHNATGTLAVVGASHLPIGRSPSLTTVGSVTVPSLARSASNVNWSYGVNTNAGAVDGFVGLGSSTVDAELVGLVELVNVVNTIGLVILNVFYELIATTDDCIMSNYINYALD